MFSKSFVINLPHRKDRLDYFQSHYPLILPSCEVWPAVHGDEVRCPDWWKAGGGAWGCYRSHMQILEHCYQRKIESYIVFEDDAIFVKDFDESLQQFMANLPDDWEQIYLGGQLLHVEHYPPQRIADGVYFPRNVNRTHCFAVHRRGYEKLYKHLNAFPFADADHIDHHVGRLHDSGNLRLYVPGKWIVGQDGGRSDIARDAINGVKFWPDPESLAVGNKGWKPKTIRTVFLEAATDIAVELERRGWHRGYWQNEQRLDRGVCNALVGQSMKEDLLAWERAVIPEAVKDGKVCVCLFHPSLSWPCVQSVGFKKITRIVATSVRDAEEQLEAIADEESSKIARSRNLIYHIYPRKGITWRWNVDQLIRRIDQFDGVRSIGVAIGDDTESIATVQDAFKGQRIDNWIIMQNDPKRGETVTFGTLLQTLPKNDQSITFYGHAKGVTHDGDINVRNWTAIMYEVCLDNQEYVDSSLDQYPVTGPFKNTKEYTGMMVHGWHYSGTFFWFRNSDLFSRDWQNIQQEYYGSEKYLGNHFTRAEAGDLFGGNVGWLYHVSEMGRVGVMLDSWRKRSKTVVKQKVIPIYINARNLLTPMRRMVEYLLKIPNARPIIIDNDSTWGPLLDWYKNECPVEVIMTGVNGGKFGWSKHLIDHKAEGIDRYVVTDPDLILDDIPLDILERLSYGLDINPGVTKVGLSLDVEQIPDEYPLKKQVVDWECQFWAHRVNGFCRAGIDTTFSMRRVEDSVAFETHGHMRADRPYTAEHWPWHWTPDVIAASEEIRHYLSTAKTDGLHWTAAQTSAAG